MGVTDLNQMPWWTQQGGQPQGGPTPPGYGGTSWLDYLASMFGPGSAQAATNSDPPPAMHNFSNPPPANGPGPGNVGPVPVQGFAGHVNANAPPGAPALTPNPTPTLASSVTMAPPGQGALAQARGVANPPFPDQGGGPSWFHSGNTPMPWNGPPTAGGLDPATMAAARTAFAAPSPAAPGGATGAPRAAPMGGGPANNRFVQLDQGQNMDPTNRRGGPQMTALNLGGLFGGGQPAAPAAAAAAPRVPGPMAGGPLISPTTGQPMPMSSADAAYGLPDARGAPYPYAMGGPSITARRGVMPGALAAASLKQRYG